MSSIIVRRLEVAEPAGQCEQRDSERISNKVPFTLSKRPARAWVTELASLADVETVRPYLDQFLDTLLSATMLGGVFVVPIATLVAVICVWMPATHPLHRTAPTFFAFASFWFMAALVMSHFQPHGAGDARRRRA